MAVLKVTLDYFPHIERSYPMKAIGAEFGEKGDTVMWTIFEEIFMRGRGYFCEWNDDVALMFTKKEWLTVGVSAVSEILNSMFRRGLLNRELFNKRGILTSVWIQETYFEAVKRRKKVPAIKEYLLINADKIYSNVYTTSLNVNISLKNVDNIEQRKGKEIKGNIKENIYTEVLLIDNRKLKISFPYIDIIKKKFPNVDVIKEIDLIKTFFDSNPDCRKTTDTIHDFINRWMKKRSEKGVNANDGKANGNSKATSSKRKGGSSPYKGGLEF